MKEIREIFPDKFPENYENNVAHWGNFSVNELHQTNPDGTQKLLHLDIDFGNSCRLDCPHCFRRDDRFDLNINKDFLKEEEILNYLKEAKSLGLQSVKFLGRGEPFENKDFIGFLRKLKDLKIKTSVFTKGHVIGDDELVKRYNSEYGINNGKELAEELEKLDVSVLLGFNSFDKEMQEKFINSGHSKIKNYTELRDNALKLLVDAGLNNYKEGKETRLAMIAAPIKPENIDEIFKIYEWSRRRNIYTVSCPSNLTGKGLDETERVSHSKDYISKLINLYTEIYIWNIENNLQTLEQFKKEGVALYPGCHPCNQTAAGMYMSLSGKVIRCPGRADEKSTFSKDIRKDGGIKDVWLKSENYKRAEGKIKSPEKNDMNYHCPARDLPDDENEINLSSDFYKKIKENVLEHFNNK